MGTWGMDSFENDDAMDWVGEFCDAPSNSKIKTALQKVAEFRGEYLEAPECQGAIAAAEVIAALKGFANEKMPDELADWVKRQKGQVDSDLVKLAKRAMERVRTNSELKDLWEEEEVAKEDREAWFRSISSLEERLIN